MVFSSHSVESFNRFRPDEATSGWAFDEIPSVSVARVKDGVVVSVSAYGLQSPGQKATSNTLYNIASMTKPISSEVVLRLASCGTLNLDEPMCRFWIDPDIACDERHKLLTPRLALSHQTGLPNWRSETGGVLAFQCDPGSTFTYSGEGYEYLARFIERKTGNCFEQLAQSLVLDPAGMRDTSYTARSWFRGRMAFPANGQGEWLAPEVADKLTASHQMYTTTSDYAKFMMSVIASFGVTDEIANQRRTIHVRSNPERCPQDSDVDTGEDFGYALGWEIIESGGETFLWHRGTDYGVFSIGYMNLSRRMGTVIFTNSANGPRAVIPTLEWLGEDSNFIERLRLRAGLPSPNSNAGR